MQRMRMFTLTTVGYDAEGPPHKYILKLRVFGHNYKHAAIKANKNIKYRNDKEIKAGGNLIYSSIPLHEERIKTEEG